MEPASSVSESTQETPNAIKTFVFLDLEATGLRGPETRILELSMVAVSRDDLLGMNINLDIGGASVSSPWNPESEDSPRSFPTPKLPRVLHKYIRLYNPRKLITPFITEMTGLRNDLHSLPGFTASSAEIISLFLELPKPLCLVAHNGDGYDFPLLMAELKNVCDLKTFGDVLCTDTLPAIKNIDALQTREQKVNDVPEDISDTEPPRKRQHRTKPKPVPRQSYRQMEIYKRLFGTEYMAHNAETDCLALLEICGHYSKDFVAWADSNAKHFCLSKPLWEKN